MSHKNLSAKIKIPKYIKKKLNNKNVRQIYQRFEKSLKIDDNFIVAVSGGPDSLALAFLSKIYSIKKRLEPKYFIIDHKLRVESTKEAKLVSKILKKYNINATILTWRGKKPSKNIQSLARNKRYELLFKKSNQLKINNILLGHHQDDLIENFFLRMIRGSGLKGLISFSKKNKIGNNYLLRPLLGEKKEDLIFLSKFVFNFYVQDPTNDDDKYKRVKIRKLISELEISGLDKNKFLKTIDNLQTSNSVVEFLVDETIDRNTHFSVKKNKVIINNDFFLQPFEVIFRALSKSIKLIGKKYYAPRGKKLDRIIGKIEKKPFFKETLGGCVIQKVEQTVIISKEH